MPSTRIVFMGTPEFAVPSLEALLGAGYPVAGVVTGPDKPRGRGREVSPTAVKSAALKHGVSVLQPEALADPSFVDAVRRLAPDLIVVVAYGRLLPKAVLDLPPLGCVNLHPSLLPRYRGPSPIPAALLAGNAVVYKPAEATPYSALALAELAHRAGFPPNDDMTVVAVKIAELLDKEKV